MRHSIRHSLVAIALAASVALGVGGLPAGPAAARPSVPFVEAAPRSNRVVMFTDSVGLGARGALPRAFPGDWEVNVDGQPARFVEQLEAEFVRSRLATNPGWFGDHVVIAAGYNYPYWDPERFERSIDSMIDTLTAAGVEHVYWVTLREVKPQYISAGAWRQVQPYYWYFPTVNDHLEQALTRHPNLTLVDWAAAADRSGVTYDAIHLNNTGADLYSLLIRRAIDAATTKVGDESITRVSVPNGAGAAVAAVNLTTTDPRHQGHLRVWDCDGPPPLVAVHTYQRATTVAHAGIAPLDPDGDFCVFAKTATNLVVDVTGVFVSGDDLRRIEPVRWLDTRQSVRPIEAGGTVELDVADIAARVGGASDWSAVAVVATAIGADDTGWLRIVGCDAAATTETANVSYRAGSTTPNLAIVEPDADGTICITSRARTHVTVDLFGVFELDADVRADRAVRWFDSRDNGTRLPAGSVTVLDVATTDLDPASAGVVVNISAIDPSEPGFVVAYPCDVDRPLAANLNARPGGVVANATIVAPAADGTVCVFNRSETHLVIDLMGEVGTGFAGSDAVRALDTRTP